VKARESHSSGSRPACLQCPVRRQLDIKSWVQFTGAACNTKGPRPTCDSDQPGICARAAHIFNEALDSGEAQVGKYDRSPLHGEVSALDDQVTANSRYDHAAAYGRCSDGQYSCSGNQLTMAQPDQLGRNAASPTVMAALKVRRSDIAERQSISVFVIPVTNPYVRIGHAIPEFKCTFRPGQFPYVAVSRAGLRSSYSPRPVFTEIYGRDVVP